jgi:hypothetical protein
LEDLVGGPVALFLEVATEDSMKKANQAILERLKSSNPALKAKTETPAPKKPKPGWQFWK